MAIITALTAERMLEIEAASIVDGEVVGSNLILEKNDGSTVNAGNVRGPQGLLGPQGIQGPPGPATGVAGGVLSGTYPNPNFATPVAAALLPLGSDWSASATPTSPPYYYKNPFGEVTVEGCLAPVGSVPTYGDASVMGTLPEGFRPPRPLPFSLAMANPARSRGSYTAIALVQTNGEIIWDPADSSGAWVSLCGIHFRAA